MQPIPEAVAWAERADAWAQRPPEGEQGGQVQRSRWSEVASTGRPAFPADGVGWRTETAEWRATEQTARWRQTTEWRSASGTHGWRSTTEAWHTGAGAENFLPPTGPETRQQLAISGTAWPTPQGDEQSGATHQPTDDGPATGSWQRFTDGTPPWQPSSDARPAWQQFTASPAPWEQPAGEPGTATSPQQPAPAPWQQGDTTPRDPARWEQTVADPARTGSTWQRLVEHDPPFPAGGTPISGAATAGTYTGGAATAGTYSGGVDPGRHLVREDDRARWRRDTDDGARPGGRRRAPEPGSRTSAGTGWSTRSDADNWAGHTDTGNIQMFDKSAVTDAPTWGARSEAPVWRPATEVQPRSAGPSWQPSSPPTIGRQDTSGRGGPVWQDDDRDAPPRREGGRRRAEDDAPSWRDGASGRSTASDWREGAAASGASDGPRDRGRTGTPDWRDDLAAPARPDETPRAAPTWQHSAPAAIGWQRDDDHDVASRRRDAGRPPGGSGWRENDGEAPGRQTGRGWREDDRAAPGWQRDDSDDPGWDDTGSVTGNRRRAAAPADPWAQSAADTGIIPFSGEPPATDTGSWRPAGTVGRARPSNPNRRRDEDADPRSGETSSRLGAAGTRADETGSRIGRRRAGAGEAEPVAPEVWQRAAGARTDGANWPVDEPATDWRRRLQAEQDEPPTGWRRQLEADPDQPPADWRRDLQADPDPPPADWRRDLQADPDPPPADWRRDLRAGPEQPAADWRRQLRADEEPPVSDAVTEVRQRLDPVDWQRDEADQAARGTATYREGNTGDWRRGLAAESSSLVDGESRRFGTQDFVPFRPVGSAAVVPAPAPVSAPAEPAPRREELLVRNDDAPARPPERSEQWPPRRPAGYESAATGQGPPTGAYERRPVGGGLATASGRPNDLLEPDEDEIEEDTGGPLAAVGYTVVWYGVPVVLFVLYMLVLNGSQQAQALSTLADAAPQFGLSLMLSMVVAVGLRWASGSWKAASVGLAAAVMGGGLATVLSSAITGNSLS